MIPKKIEVLIQKVGDTETRVVSLTSDMFQPKQYGQDCNRGKTPTAIAEMPHPYNDFILHVRIVEP